MTMAILSIPLQTLAAMYDATDADCGPFGTPTSVETVITAEEDDNVNRSKDSSYVPPAFGSPSSNTPGTGELLTPNIAGVSTMPSGESAGSVYVGSYPEHTTTEANGSSQVISDSSMIILPPDVDPGTPYSPSSAFTLPDGLYYADGSLGTLSIPKLGLTVKVYEDESLESLAKGAGHFKFTSCWDGNVGLAGHNRGVTNHFGQIHTLSNGDRITYTTKLGTRTYSVYFVGQINETDFSRLERTDSNIITLVTCVANIPSLRWCVQAREI